MRRYLAIKWLTFGVGFFIAPITSGQLITDTTQTPLELVQNSLIGPGVFISNLVYTGASTAIGTFNASGTNLGIESGVILTTGTVLQTEGGPHGPNDASGAGVENGSEGSDMLSTIIGEQTYNAAVLEFDFVTYTGKIELNYVFGSEEYPEFAPPNSSTYNDVFAFVISGPGMEEGQNIAQLPNGNGQVSINNVNAVTNTEYYVPNGSGSEAPYNDSEEYIQYDGYTTKLHAQASVEVGEIYHLTIAIADAGDASWDSGIFLEKNSLSASTTLLSKDDKNILKILDLMGRETSFEPNTPLIYVYDDGSTEKVFSVKY